MNNLGLYIHIPFCLQKCRYCDFYSLPCGRETGEAYIEKVCGQIDTLSALCVGRNVDTVYIGGGTPSILDPRCIVRLMKKIGERFSLMRDAEITIEANPATVSAQALEAYRAAGINRISFGVQSYDDETLHRIGRLHSFADALDSIGTARDAGFENISADLMYALPGQKDDEIENAFRALLPLGITHISLYGLKIEENTPFGRDKTLILPDEDAQCAAYLSAVELFEKQGFAQYEISNFARPGFESRHNLRYWRREEYLGFGPAAHSFFGGVRFSIGRDLKKYMACEDFSLSSDIYENKQSVDAEEAFSEELMLLLRLKAGFPRDRFLARVKDRTYAERYLQMLEKNGLCGLTGENFALTPRGMLVSNSIISDLQLLL